MTTPEGREAHLIIATERAAWILMFTMLALASAAILILVIPPGVGGAFIAMPFLFLAVAVYSGACVVWHRRHRDTPQ